MEPQIEAKFGTHLYSAFETDLLVETIYPWSKIREFEPIKKNRDQGSCGLDVAAVFLDRNG